MPYAGAFEVARVMERRHGTRSIGSVFWIGGRRSALITADLPENSQEAFVEHTASFSSELILRFMLCWRWLFLIAFDKDSGIYGLSFDAG